MNIRKGSVVLSVFPLTRETREALRLLETELKEQVLADGGHFERNPGYHVAVLRGILELRAWLEANRRPVPEWLSMAARSMHMFLSGILTPGGSLPLLKDTTLDLGELDRSLFESACLGRPQPADALSFELHVAGAPLIVDPGVYEYQAGPCREASDSTLISVEHDGYLRLAVPVRHRRTIRANGRGECLADWSLPGVGR